MKRVVLLLFAFVSCVCVSAQSYFHTTGHAKDVFSLTSKAGGQSGAIWHHQQIDMNFPFEIVADLYFGDNDGGADGMAFVLQDKSTDLKPATGGGLGYSGYKSSLAVEFDTYKNSNYRDPYADHFDVMLNGDTKHVGYPVSCSNIENGKWHRAKFTWNPSTSKFAVYFNGKSKTYYWKNPLPYCFWGFTASTGGAYNSHQVKIVSYNIEAYNPPVIPSSFSLVPYSSTLTEEYKDYIWMGYKGSLKQVYLHKSNMIVGSNKVLHMRVVYLSNGNYAIQVLGYKSTGNYYLTVSVSKRLEIVSYPGSIPAEGQFKIRPPKNGIHQQPQYLLSIESIKYPAYYVKNAGYMVTLTKHNPKYDSKKTKDDFTWKLR